jgi:hypothetical protein
LPDAFYYRYALCPLPYVLLLGFPPRALRLAFFDMKDGLHMHGLLSEA